MSYSILLRAREQVLSKRLTARTLEFEPGFSSRYQQQQTTEKKKSVLGMDGIGSYSSPLLQLEPATNRSSSQLVGPL